MFWFYPCQPYTHLLNMKKGSTSASRSRRKDHVIIATATNVLVLVLVVVVSVTMKQEWQSGTCYTAASIPHVIGEMQTSISN
jgi:hypothetical protein